MPNYIKPRSLATALIVLAVFKLAAAPGRGSETLPDLYSTAVLGGGAFVSRQGGSVNGAINPAATAADQLLSFDVGYISLPNFDGTGFGQAANLGLVLPMPYAVFNSFLHFHSSPWPAYPIGRGTSFKIGVSKDLYSSLSVGAALGAGFGFDADDSFDWRLGLDLGVQGGLGDFGLLKNLRYGLVLTGIGSTGWLPAPFTPTIGAAFDLIKAKTGDFSVGLVADLGFPAFSNLIGRAGLELQLGQLIHLTAASGFNLRELLDGQAAWAIPSVGLSVNLAIPGKPAENQPSEAIVGRVALTTATRPLYDRIWAFGAGAVVSLGVPDRQGPEIEIDYPEPVWISPNSDGKADYLEFPLKIADQRYITGWLFEIHDSTGQLVRRQTSRERRVQRQGFQDLLDRLIDFKSSVEIPEFLRWDGIFDSGYIASDGTYSFSVTALDDNANYSVSPVYLVHVDTTPPAVTIHSPKRGEAVIFSPDGDGFKDEITINQSGSVEALWEAVFYNATGTAVRHFRFLNTEPENLVWDGYDDAGRVVPDGAYWYEIKAVDPGRNERSASVDHIIVNTERPTASLSIDEAWISPNGDGIKDQLWFGADASSTSGLVAWELEIFDSERQVQRLISGKAGLPKRILFDGYNSQADYLSEGEYFGALAVQYSNGFIAVAESPSFRVDLSPPEVSLLRPGEETLRTFSPDGDGRKDTFKIVQTGSHEELWTAVISDISGKPLRNFRWENSQPRDLVWDGLDDAGNPVPDGHYSYEIMARDRAGNGGSASLTGIIVDKSRPTVSLSLAFSHFSPNGDGIFDELPILILVQKPASTESWTMEVLDSSGAVRRQIAASGAVPERLLISGQDDLGQRLSEGIYRARLTVSYRNGFVARAESPEFILDLTPPRATVGVRTPIFSPNRDGYLDTAILTHEGSPESTWIGEIRRVSDSGKLGDLVKTISLPGVLPKEIEWDGLDDGGRLAADGLYSYRVVATDRAGNSGASNQVNFQLTTADTPLLITADRPAFSPNNDGLHDSLLISPQVQVKTGIVDWRYEILDQSAKTLRVYSGERTLPPAFRWDGRDDSGQLMSDGLYSARLSLSYDMGNKPVATTPPFKLDTTAPWIHLSVPDTIFSPNFDGVKDILQINRQCSSEPDDWIAFIANIVGTRLRTWTWRGAAGPFTWDGKDDAGNWVPDGEYLLQAESRDAAGNYGGAIIENLIVDTKAPYLELVIADPVLSPNGDGIKDWLNLEHIGGGEDSWTAELTDNQAKVVRTWHWQAEIGSLKWDGRDDDGRLMPDGIYHYRVFSRDLAGNFAEFQFNGIRLDTKAPVISFNPPYKLFSPNGDGRKDTLPFRLLTEGDDEWSAAIVDGEGRTVQNYWWKGEAPAIVWNGRDLAGNIVADGIYSFRAASVDTAGNSCQAELGGLVVDNRTPQVYLTVANTVFKPDGDGSNDGVVLESHLNFSDGIESWKFEVLDENAAVHRVRESPARAEVLVPAQFIWDGRDTGGVIKPGRYSVRLTVVYVKGDVAFAQSIPFQLDLPH